MYFRFKTTSNNVKYIYMFVFENIFSNNSLFAVPGNQEFVHMHDNQLELTDPVQLYLEQLRSNTSNNRESGT